MTLSGIFRDLLPLQIEAAGGGGVCSPPRPTSRSSRISCASTRSTYQKLHGCDLETAALRVFGNADGAYGSNVNLLIDSGRWNDEDELAETYTRRKGFAYGRTGSRSASRRCCKTMLADVDLAYQNLESVELGVTTIDHYFDTLGGISRAVRRAKGQAGACLYRRPDARRRHGAHARRAGGARDAHAHAQSEMVRGHAEARL